MVMFRGFRHPHEGYQTDDPAKFDEFLIPLINSLAQEAVLFHRLYPPPTGNQPNSYFGGLPKMPADLDWPTYAGTGNRMTFLGQIDVSELPDFAGRSALPAEGTLYFFSDTDNERYIEVHQNNFATVLYSSSDPSTHAIRQAPDDLIPIYGTYHDYEIEHLGRGTFLRGSKTLHKWLIRPFAFESFPEEHPSLADLGPFSTADQEDVLGRYQELADEMRPYALRSALKKVGLYDGEVPRSHNGVDIQLEEPEKHPHRDDLFWPGDGFPWLWAFVDVAAPLLTWGIDMMDQGLADDSPRPGSSADLDLLSKIKKVGSKFERDQARRVLYGLKQEMEDLHSAAIEADRLAQVPAPVQERFEKCFKTLEETRKGVGGYIGSVSHPWKRNLSEAVAYSLTAGKGAASVISDMGFTTFAPHIDGLEWNSIGGPTMHQMFGSGYFQYNRPEFTKTAHMLMQFDTDWAVPFSWADVGTLQFWIQPDDLANLRFDRTKVTVS